MLKSIFEALANDTWQRLRDSRALEIRFGEETVTDLVLLELKRSQIPGIEVLQTNKKAESNQGTDWEWWLGSPQSGWLRFAIQAKKLDPTTFRYSKLSHKVSETLQIDILERYAQLNKAIPMYCLFNFVEGQPLAHSWQCCQPPDTPQLGCTITPLRVIRQAMESHGCRTFSWIHQQPQSLPWRCLARCASVRQLLGDVNGSLIHGPENSERFMWPAHRHPELPVEVARGRDRGRVTEFHEESYKAAAARYPSRIVVVDIDSLPQTPPNMPLQPTSGAGTET